MNKLGIIVLAAGLGKRMRSSIPKVLHEVAGVPLLHHILFRIHELSPDISVAVVVGHGREKVEKSILDHSMLSKMKISFVHQTEQKGTGHAARCAMESEWGESFVKSRGNILILPGDQPLITLDLLKQVSEPIGRSVPLRLLTCHLPNPTGYGRVVRRGKKGGVLRIVEERDATQREREINEVAVSIYLFQAGYLKAGLQRLNQNNAQNEYYLTDLVAQAGRAKKPIDVLAWASFEDVRGINDPWELAEAHRALNHRIIVKAAKAGTKFFDAHSVWIDAEVQLGEDVLIYPGAMIFGQSQVHKGAIIGPYVVLRDCVVGEGAHLKVGTVAEQSVIGPRATLGPYCHLRPDSQVMDEAKIGNFVELKNSQIGRKTSIAHLSYVGDATVGAQVNIGCGFVTCNYDGRIVDGRKKHPTVIEDGAFIGSDCQTVAPVKVGKGAYVASGSTITEDVEADALAIARSRQVNKPGYAKKIRSTEGGK